LNKIIEHINTKEMQGSRAGVAALGKEVAWAQGHKEY